MTTKKSRGLNLRCNAFVAFCGVLAMWAAGHLLYSAYSAFTWAKFNLFDYGIYTNMIWNSGHGDWFRCLVGRSYLKTHLSFSLGPLGWLYRLWDHPFLLSFLQWSFMLIGGAVLWRTASRKGVSRETTAALLLFWAGYPFTQRVLLSEFHGTGFYFLLVPWLYHALCFHRALVWVPLLLVLGVREDAFIFILPMLIYFAAKRRTLHAAALPAVALGYGLFALLYLFPLINGMSILERRSSSLGGVSLLDPEAMSRRLHALGWTLLPCLPFLGKRWLPVLLFPSAALLSCLLSSFARQQGLSNHYAAPVLVCLAVGILEAAGSRPPADAGRAHPWRAYLLALLTVGAHFVIGLTTFGGRSRVTYRQPHLSGRVAVHAASHLPKEGLLVTEPRFSSFCANRGDLLSFDIYEEEDHVCDLVFTRVSWLKKYARYEPFLEAVRRGTMGVRYFDGMFLILERGYDTAGNADFLQKLDHGFIKAGWTKGGIADNRFRDGHLARYWEGDGSRAFCTIVQSKRFTLPPGDYRAVFRYRVRAPRRDVRHSWGRFGVIVHGETPRPVVEEVRKEPTPAKEYLTHEIAFALDREAEVEPQVAGADAELWIDTIRIYPGRL